MKKSISIAFLIVLLCIAGILYFNHSEQEVQVDSFVLINDRPFMLQAGMAYYWTEEGKWVRYGVQEKLVQLYRGESFCALSQDGYIIYENENADNQDEYKPLTSQYTDEMRWQLLELNKDYPIKNLNKNPDYLDCWVLLENGVMMINTGGGYSAFSIENEIIEDISGDFALTADGLVYKLTISDDKNVSWNLQNAEKKIQGIQSCESAPRCMGIYDNGQVVIWSDLQALNLSEWEDVCEVSTGFNYAVGLTAGGKVLYADYKQEREHKVKEYLSKKKKVVHIASNYNILALLFQDGHAEVIHLDEI